ncbi:MAG: TIGR03067 domain-containing protein [Planctomycetota bacterium]|jgi:uncharacterized protein (TIGR03067 family)
MVRTICISAMFAVGFLTTFPVQGDAAEVTKQEATPQARMGPAVSSQHPTFRAVDDFDGELALDWKPLRHDSTHVSLTKNAGKLTITTQFGSMHLRRDPEMHSKNVFLIDNPQPEAPGFVVTTCLDSFQPVTAWQQAGLILFDDEDNYLKFVLEFNNRTGHAAGVGPIWNLLREVEGESSITKTEIEGDIPQKAWLRLTVRGGRHEYATSTDGKGFTIHGELPWGDGSPSRVGLLATNGGNSQAADLDACFACFEARSLTPDEESDPRWTERRKLAGAWEAVESQINGKPSEHVTLSRFVFTDTRVTVKEGTKTLPFDYTVDALKQPKQLTLSTFSGSSAGQIRAIYSVDDDALTLCINLRAEGEAPSGFETKEGDGRLLVKLKRSREDI